VPLLLQPVAGSLVALASGGGAEGGLIGALLGVEGLDVVGAVLLDFALALAAQVADLALVAPLVGFSRLEDCTQLAQDVMFPTMLDNCWSVRWGEIGTDAS